MSVSFPRGIRLLFCWLALHLITASNVAPHLATAEDKPAWQNGISTWNGTGYSSPTISGQAPKFSLPTAENSPRPYTLPTDPNMTNANKVMSAQLFTQNQIAADEPTSSPIQEALPVPVTSPDFPTANIASIPEVPPAEKSEWQTKLELPTASIATNDSTDSQHEATTAVTFSTLPSIPLHELPDSTPESLTTKKTTENESHHLPLPSPETNQVAAPSPSDTGPDEAAGNVETQSASSTATASGTDDSADSDVKNAAWDSPESAPLEAEVTRWYEYPRAWIKGWDSHAEFGLDGSDGNANTLAMQAGLELKRTTKRYTLGMDVNYRQASSRNETTEQNGRFNVNFDRLLGDTSWSAFAKHGMEWDKFKPFDLRLNLNGGVGYYWVRSDTSTLATRFGAGASREIGAPIDDWIPEAVFGMEAERQITSRQKLKGKFDYFPAWEDFGDYRLVSDVSWEILLDGSENLSLKLAATDRYDSTPQGAKPNDVYYSLLLLYKF